MTEQSVTDGRTARRDRNKVAVLDAVLQLISEGELTPSPEAIALRSGMSLRSVYRYMRDMDDLARAAIDRHLERVGPLFAFEALGEGPLDDRIQAFVTSRLALHEEIAPIARAALARTRMRSIPAGDVLKESLNARRALLRVQPRQSTGS